MAMRDEADTPRRKGSPAALFAALLLGWGTTRLPAETGLPPAVFADAFEAGSVVAWDPLSTGYPPFAPCAAPLAPVDTQGATVVGDGTPGSCDEAALDLALASNNGQIRFDCGAAPHTIVVTAEKTVTSSLVLDGSGTVTLSGGGATRILGFRPPAGMPTLTLQHLTLRDGYTGDLPGTTTASGGAAVYRASGGHLEVLGCRFEGNVGPATGQDVAGGAIYSFGVGTTTIVGSTFLGNRCSSGGALGALGVDGNHLVVVNSVLAHNAATGSGGNPGNGGNGGAIYVDGNNQSVALCGARLVDNAANARGGGLFRVSNNGVGPMTIDRSLVYGNSIPDGAASQAGGLYLQGLQLTVDRSTIARNLASSTGGIFVATNPGSQTLAMTNSTVAGNVARTGLGAGMAVAAAIPGTLHHVTLAGNANLGAASFASALAGGDSLAL
ncbi:MAG TPA: hypothetical protein VLA75_04135, partial [Thermoanaerobaculia bacterium]|nr:hypothetical protein [Thermoanaerobaculia bacterium]